MKRAFTLIELLVVIAIIAILAAILFPVFAQAKEAAKKTAALTQMKQWGTSLNMYATDYDDNLPQAYAVFSSDNAVYYDLPAPFPAGFSPTLNALWPIQDQAATWGNSMQPYIKNQQIGEISGFNRRNAWVNAVYTAAGAKPAGALAFTYNGYLHCYNMSGIASPSSLTVFFNGLGRQNAVGGMYAVPNLDCPNPGPCRYNPGGRPQTGAPATQFTYWISPDSMWAFGQSSIFVAADSSAKARRIASRPGNNVAGQPTAGDWRFDPYARYTSLPAPSSMWTTTLADGTVYGVHFQPDVER